MVPRMCRASQESAVTLGWLGRYRSAGSPRLVMLSGVRAVDLGAQPRESLGSTGLDDGVWIVIRGIFNEIDDL